MLKLVVNHLQSCWKNSNRQFSSIKLSQFLASHTDLGRNGASKAIQEGEIAVNGRIVRSPGFILSVSDLLGNKNESCHVKFNGKLVQPNTVLLQERNNSTPKVWAVHKLKGELVTHDDPQNRFSLMDRLFMMRKFSRFRKALKPVGRLDMNTEGLILVTTCGSYARELELPKNEIHRTYRARVHGNLTPEKLKSLRKGLNINNIWYKGMDVRIEKNKESGTNTWLRVTCTEGKNRQVRKMLEQVRLQVTRLIRVSFGDYNLFKIPPGMVEEMVYKPVVEQKKRGKVSSVYKRGDKIDKKIG